MEGLNASSLRAEKARLARRIGPRGTRLSVALASILAVTAVALLSMKVPHAGLLGAAAGVVAMWAFWLTGELNRLPSSAPSGSAPLGDVLDPWLLGRLDGDEDVPALLHLASKDWRGSFVLVRVNAAPAMVMGGAELAEREAVWKAARTLAVQLNAPTLHAGHLATAILSQPSVARAIKTGGIDPEETVPGVAAWLERTIREIDRERPTYGGLGRDWAAGFTPTLDYAAADLSRQIALNKIHLGSLLNQPIVEEMLATITRGQQGIALIGGVGSGRSSIIAAFAQRLIEGDGGPLAFRHVKALDASTVAAGRTGTGDTERLFLAAIGEAVHAGNIVLALDDARSFLGNETGTVDLTNMLLPALESRRLPIIMAFTPDEWQHLLSVRPALAAALSPLTVPEPSRAQTLDILADTALTLEARGRGAMITFGAITEAYTLSGRYLTDTSYPGRAIRLLEAAASRAQGPKLTKEDVQRALEGMIGIKVAPAEGPEANVLLDLEDKIHQRMINQSRAVSAVAAALRRARAGVASPKRPVGSFLFLGPTGVGKTELAKSLAGVYFGDEQNLVRLDMSEYSGPGDAARLLDASSGSFATQMRERPFSVVLLDELEKAHPNVLNLMLQMLDEGRLTDAQGREVRLRDAIIIATSNAGADEIRARVEAGESPDAFEPALVDTLISSGAYRPELLNRFDDIVVFRPLNQEELAQVVRLMLAGVNKTLADRQVQVALDDAAVAELVRAGNDPRLGARPMRRIVQRRVEDAVADKLLRGELQPGQTLKLSGAEFTASTSEGPTA